MAADIGQELFEQILKRFNEKYKKAQLFGGPISETLKKIKKGEATFQDADMYATDVGVMMSEAITETVVFDELPNQTMYYNIAKKIIEPSLQKEYNLISNVATAIQDTYNHEIGTRLKAAKPEFNQKRSDSAIEGVVKAQSQESFNASVAEPVKTFALTVVDDTKRKNAEIHFKAGLKVTVSREYDRVGLRRGTKYAKVCDFCDKREGTDVPYDKAYAMGMFQRHDGCGCIIEYTSKKGEKTYSTGKDTGWSKEKPKEIEQRIKISTNYDRKRQLVKNNEIENKRILGTEIKVKKIDEKEYEIFVSEASTFKQNDLQNLKKGINKSLNKLGIKNTKNFPTIVIATMNEMKGAVGLYNPIKNQLVFSDVIGNKGYMVKIQNEKDLADPDNPISSIKHEIIHWSDAQEYIKEFGVITENNIREYDAYRQNESLKILDSLGIYEYNVHKFGQYAFESYFSNDFDEAYTEYRVVTV